MPRTRIRGRSALVVTQGGGTTGSSTNPVGSSLTTDDIGSIGIILAETPVQTPVDDQTFALTASSAETNAAPTDAINDYFIVYGPTDTPNTPTGGHSTAILAGATTATATNTAGNGWATPANAQGLNDGTNATANSAAGLGAANQAGTLVLAFASMGTPSTETVAANPVLTVYASLTVGLLASGSLALSYSTDGGNNYSAIGATLTASNAGPFTVTLTGFTLANLANLRVRAVASVTGSATGAGTATVDAAVVAFTTTGSAG